MNKLKIIGITGKGNLPSYISVAILSALVAWACGFFPYRSDRYLLFSVPLGITVFLSTIWQIRKPMRYTKYFWQVSGSALIALLAYGSMSYLFPQISPYTEVLMIFGFLFVHTLSFWNLPLATLIGDELYVPKTWVGKIIFRAILFVAPLGVVAGNFLGKGSANKNAGFIFIAGIICLYLAYSFPFPSLSRYSQKGNKIPLRDKRKKSKSS